MHHHDDGNGRGLSYRLFFDFRIPFLTALVLITLAGFSSPLVRQNEGLLYYLVCLVTFIGFFIVGSLGSGRYFRADFEAARAPIVVSPSQLATGRLLFIGCQLYYASIPFLVLSTGGFRDLERTRFEIAEHINQYLFVVAFLGMMIGIVYEMGHAFTSRGAVIQRHSVWVIMSALLLVETLAIGSRSLLLVPVLGIGFVLLRFKTISIKQGLAVAAIILFGSGLGAYLRIASNEETYDWWIRQGIMRPDQDPLTAAMIMLQFTISDMVYRPVEIIHAVANDVIQHDYGYTTFYWLISILPGRQEDPAIYLNHYLFQGSDDQVGYPPNIIAQLYWDFGFVGIPLGGLALGAVGRALLRSTYEKRTPIYLLIYGFFVSQLMLSVYGVFNAGWLIAHGFALVVLDRLFAL